MHEDSAPTAAAAIRVLLVEDNPGDADWLRIALTYAEQGSFTVQHVSYLSDALRHVAAQPVDVIVLDLGLPDSEGLDGLDAMRGMRDDVPIVVLSGLSDRRMAALAVQRGAADFVVKGMLASEQLAAVVLAAARGEAPASRPSRPP